MLQFIRINIYINYRMFPVFSIIFDEDVVEKIALEFPPLYKSL